MSCDRFIVMTASTRSPSVKIRGIYRKIAIVETNGLVEPKQINPKHKSVVSIIELWDKLNVGKTEKSAFYKTLKEAEKICGTLNLWAKCLSVTAAKRFYEEQKTKNP